MIGSGPFSRPPVFRAIIPVTVFVLAQLPRPLLREFQITSSRRWDAGLATVTGATFDFPRTSFFNRLAILFETVVGAGNSFGSPSFGSPSPALLEGGVGEVNSRHQTDFSCQMVRMTLQPRRQQPSEDHC